jgi:hypothetical protein
LIEGIGAFAGLLDQLLRSSAGRKASFRKGTRMDMYSEEDLARARAEGRKEGLSEGQKTGRETGYLEGKADGAKEGYEAGANEGRGMGAEDERARIKAILTHPEAKGREASANHLALNTPMNSEDAAGALAGLAKTSGIAARAAGTIAPTAVTEHVPDENMQPGAVSWASVADRLNAETLRRADASR